MDWLDQYLDALSDGTNVVYPPDTHTWRPYKPTKQQQRLIQDSIVNDLQQYRLVEEARRQLEESGANSWGGIDSGSSPTNNEGPVDELTYLEESLLYTGENLILK